MCCIVARTTWLQVPRRYKRRRYWKISASCKRIVWHPYRTVNSSSLRGPSPKTLTLLGKGLGLSPGAWGVPFLGNANGNRGIFEAARRVWGMALRLDLPKKALCHTRPSGGTFVKYRYWKISVSSKTNFGRNTHSARLIIFVGLYHFRW